jgi:sulfite reductase (NADPH) flavoprotein alpha-component
MNSFHGLPTATVVNIISNHWWQNSLVSLKKKKQKKMLAEHKLKALTELSNSLSKEELIWVNGYFSGLVAEVHTSPKLSVSSGGNKKLTIAYGTETGNSKKLAVEFAAKAKKNGVQAKLVGLDQYRFNDLTKEEYFITVISTQGEGEPPVGAQKFYDHLHNNGFKVPAMKYAVLALGDTSYPMFCKTGEDVDTQLEKLGAKRFYPLQKCDLDYEEEATQWFSDLLNRFSSEIPETATAPLTEVPVVKKAVGKKIYKGRVVSNINLNARGSSKTTFHIEIQAEAVEYLPGDSIGIVPQNDPLVVAEILSIAGIAATELVMFKNEEFTVADLLTTKINIRFLLEKFVLQYAQLTGASLQGRQDLVTLMRIAPLNDREKFITYLQSLHTIAPRIYNIASSIAAHGEEVHIIALKDEFEIDNIKQVGQCSAFLEEQQEGSEISFFIQPNKRFRLPADDKDIIMIGPGTGIAPFRSFTAERDVSGASGRNWLFFGEEKFTTDFYYQTEWQNWFGTGVLTNISLSFSKDGPIGEKFSDKILEKARELFEWIESGAFVYLCGEKEPMSKEVEAALLKVFELQGGLSSADAAQYFDKLKSDGRYVKDVY